MALTATNGGGSDTNETNHQTNSSTNPSARGAKHPTTSPAIPPAVGSDSQNMGRNPNLTPVEC